MTSRRQLARTLVANGLRQRGLRTEPQAIHALAEAIVQSDPNVLGDTDTILAGLLVTGSYTLDILEEAGADRRLLKRLTLGSARGPDIWDPGAATDPLEALFADGTPARQAARLADADGRPMGTADLLRAALTMRMDGVGVEAKLGLASGSIPAGGFPIELRRDEAPGSTLLRDLEARLCEVLLFVTGILAKDHHPSGMLRTRTASLTEDEDWILDKDFGTLFRGMRTEELEFIIRALNTWFVSRAIALSPTPLCLQTVNRCTMLLFAPKYFAESGGDVQVVETGLGLAERLAPSRDVPFLALVQAGNQIHAGHFTYRNALQVSAPGRRQALEVQGVRLYAPRPVPLIPNAILSRFQRLISTPNVSEADITVFLHSHPELVLSLGYCTARPMICLTDPDSNSFLPNFILEIPNSRGHSILNLGSPTTAPFTSDPFLRMSTELTRAIGQLRASADVFSRSTERRAFERLHGVTGFRPELIVVMGRSTNFASLQERQNAEDQLGKVRLLTYDDMIAYAKMRNIALPDVAAPFDSEVERTANRRVDARTDAPPRPAPKPVSYDLALSFAGEDREAAQALADALRQHDISVFYDAFERADLWGKDLYAHLSDVYRNRARFCVMFISRHYEQNLWTNHERKAAQERAFRERQEYILPVRLDDTELPGLLGTTSYVDHRTTTTEEIVNLLRDKLGR